jgi:hypothetical protein
MAAYVGRNAVFIGLGMFQRNIFAANPAAVCVIEENTLSVLATFGCWIRQVTPMAQITGLAGLLLGMQAPDRNREHRREQSARTPVHHNGADG